MNLLNDQKIEGFVTSAVKPGATETGFPTAKFTMVHPRYFRNAEGVQKHESFFDVEAYGSCAEFCASHLKPGHFVRVSARLHEEGGYVRLVASRVDFREKKEEGGKED